MAEEASKPQPQAQADNNPIPEPNQPDPSQIGNPNLSSLPYAPPSFRPAAPPVPLPMAPQFSPIPNCSYQPGGVEPPGVGSGPGGLVYQQQMMRPSYMQMPNGYLPMPPPGGSSSSSSSFCFISYTYKFYYHLLYISYCLFCSL